MDLLAVPLAPLRLALRAVDDLGRMAEAAQHLASRTDDFEARFDRIEEQMRLAVEAGQQIDARAAEVLAIADTVLAFGERIDARAAGLLAASERIDALLGLGERIDERAGSIIELGDQVDALVRSVVDEAKLMEAAAVQVTQTGAEIAGALPLLQRAIEMSEPLEGAVERFGRMVDRLPGGKASHRTRTRGSGGEGGA